MSEAWADKARGMVDVLYRDYGDIYGVLVDAQQKLIAARQEELTWWRAHRDAKQDYEDEVAAMLATDDRAAGKNDTERRRNADNLIREEKRPGKSLHNLWNDYQDTEYKYESAKTETQSQIDRLSSARNAARMVAGLGNAFGA